MYIIGIDIGGMSIKGGVVDGANGTIVCKDSVVTKAAAGIDVLAADTAGLIGALLGKTSLKISDVAGIGIGMPGTVDSKTGRVIYSNNIRLVDAPIVEKLRKYYDNIPIEINNDANAAALGEVRFGESKDYKNIVFITLGTGVGTGLIVDGKLIEGNNSAGAEGGHMVIRVGGAVCTCGRRGCFEAYASAAALVRQTKAAMQKNKDSLMHKLARERNKISGRTAFLAAAEGDKTAAAVVNRYIRYVGEGIVNLANIFRPDVVLIGGGVSNEGDALILPLQEFMDNYCFGIKNGNPRVLVKKASLTNDAGIFGAASLIVSSVK
ncbi:MAG: ROK family protein [Clostridiales bacterium]|jgi:glucokinase|nr:ROK family protein [Clostridiales bacterium]